MYILYELSNEHDVQNLYNYVIQKEHVDIESNERFEIYAHDKINKLVQYIQKRLDNGETMILHDIIASALDSRYDYRPIREYNSLDEFIEYHMNLNPEQYI